MCIRDRNNDVDVLVMDLVLPTIDGIGVLERINRMQLNKRPHVLIAVSYTHLTGIYD